MRTIFAVGAMVMAACASSEPLPRLAGTEWSVLQAPDSFVRFEADNVVMASAGCNMLRATYQQDGDTLAMSRVMATRKMCPPELMERERDLISAIEGTLSADIRDDGKLGLLVLRNGDGRELAVLQRSDWD